MDDPLLARARLLVKIGEDAQAATAASIENIGRGHNGSPQSSGKAPSSPIRGALEYKESPMSYSSPERVPVQPEDSSFTRVKVSVIRGSSLVSCLSGGDIRATLKRGSTVEIEGVEYKLSTKIGSEWSGNRIELERDYTGETKLDAYMSIKKGTKRSPRKKLQMEPVPSSSITDAIAGLTGVIPESMRNDRGASSSLGHPPVRKATLAKSMNTYTRRDDSYVAGLDHPRPSPGAEAGQESDLNPGPLRALAMGMAVEKEGQTSSPVTGHASPPKLTSKDSSFGDEDGSLQSYAERYSSSARNAHFEAQRKAAMERAQRRKKEEHAKKLREEEIEKREAEAKKAAMAVKAEQLREKTRERVNKLRAEKKERSEVKERQERQREEEKRQKESFSKSVAYEEKMNALRRETAMRMRKKAAAEEKRKLEEQRLIEKKLNQISDSRRNHDQRTPASFGTIHLMRSGATLRSNSAGARSTSPLVGTRDLQIKPLPGATGLGNGRYAIGDASFTEPLVKQSPTRRTPPSKPKQPQTSPSPQAPLWSSAPADVSPVDTDQPQGISREPAPAEHQVYVPQQKAIPTWQRDDDEWSDDSLGGTADEPPKIPPSFEEKGPEPAPAVDLPRDVDLNRSRESIGDISAITFDASSPGRSRASKPAARASRLPAFPGGGSVASKRSTFKALKPIPMSKGYEAVPPNNKHNLIDR